MYDYSEYLAGEFSGFDDAMSFAKEQAVEALRRADPPSFADHYLIYDDAGNWLGTCQGKTFQKPDSDDD